MLHVLHKNLISFQMIIITIIIIINYHLNHEIPNP